MVDLNRVVFIDSAALHVLFKVARQRGRERLALVVEPTAAIVRTLDIVGMKDAVRIARSLEEASRVENLRPPEPLEVFAPTGPGIPGTPALPARGRKER